MSNSDFVIENGVLKKYNGEGGDVVIPDGVTSIGWGAFRDNYNISSITMPESVTSIDGRAFSGYTGLTSIIIPDSVKSIGDMAFFGCRGLTSVTIPDGVTSINYSAFSGCTGLKEITIPDSVFEISDRAFENCSGLTSIIIPDSVTSIGGWSFSGCSGLTSVTIPGSVTKINGWAFSNCTGLTSVTIPDSVTNIGCGPFSGCTGLTEIKVSGNNPNYSSDTYGVLFDKSISVLIQYPVGNTRASFTIPDSVTSIGDNAFGGCTGLTGVTIPDSVTSIGVGAFYNCTGLLNITIPDSVISIGNGAFQDTGYYNNAANWEKNVLYIGKHLIEVKEKPNLRNYAVKEGTLCIADWAFERCSNLYSVKLPEGIVAIGDLAFNNCHLITEIILPDSLKYIGNGAFQYCSRLNNIKIPSNVTSIGNYAFEGCDSFTSISIPEKITKISASLFYRCHGLKEAFIPDGVTVIDNRAFIDCIQLINISIPDSVTEIGGGAFNNCKQLKNIKLGENLKKIGGYCFRSCKSITSIKIPDSVTEIEEEAFAKCSSLVDVEIPISTHINETAFKDCTNLHDKKFWSIMYLTQTSKKSLKKCLQELNDDIEASFGILTEMAAEFRTGEAYEKVADFYKNNSESISQESLLDFQETARKESEDIYETVNAVIFDKKGNKKGKKVSEKNTKSIPSTIFKEKKIAFVFDFDTEKFSTIKRILKDLGGSAVTTVSKDIDIAVYSEQLIGPDSKYRSAVYQKDKNGKHLWKYSEFISELKKCGVDTSDIEDAGTIYKTDTRENQLASLKKAINDNIYFLKHEDILKFNDDFYEVDLNQNSGKYLDFDDDVLKALEKYDTQTILGTDADIKSIINAFGGYECIENIIATCIATRMFLDPKFECRFRIYRDKWEERGDYGMAYGANEVPPAIFWEISKRHPFGYCSYK